MSEKLVGYVLLLLGVGLIVYAGINVFGILSRRTAPVQIFNFEGISIDSGQLISTGSVDTSGMEPEEAAAIEKLMESQTTKPTKVEILPADVLNQTTNLIVHLILMGFIASIGYRLGGLGVLMLRPIVVKVKEKKEPMKAPTPAPPTTAKA